MKPPKTENREYEKVDTNDFVVGEIEEIQYDMEHKFTYQGNEKQRPACRFKFKINGCEFPHYSRWMTFNYGEKSNLYLKYLVPLIENAQPDMDFDLNGLQGMKVKMLWTEKNGFQSVETIRPLNTKLKADVVPEIQVNEEELTPDDEVPF